jgi:hypothetical protein
MIGRVARSGAPSAGGSHPAVPAGVAASCAPLRAEVSGRAARQEAVTIVFTVAVTPSETSTTTM